MKFSLKIVTFLGIILYGSITSINALQPATKAVSRTAPQAGVSARRYLHKTAASTALSNQNGPLGQAITQETPNVTVVPGQMQSPRQAEALQQNELFKNLVVQENYQKQQATIKRLEQERNADKAKLKGYQQAAGYAGAAALLASLYGGIVLYDANKEVFEKNDGKQINKPITLADKYREAQTDTAARIFVDDLVQVLDPFNNFSTEQQLQAAIYLEKIVASRPSLKLPVYSIPLGGYKTQLNRDSLRKKIKELNAELIYQNYAESNYRDEIKNEPSKLVTLSLAVLKDQRLQGSVVNDLARYNLAKYYMDSTYFYQKNQDAEKYLKEIIGQPLITREFESPLKSQAIALLLKLQGKNK